MAVVIHSGPLEPTDQLHDVPREKWLELLRLRRDFMHRSLSYDCRELLRFVEDAGQMYTVLGFESIEDLVRRGYKLEPEQVGWAIEGLKHLKPNEPIPYQRAQEFGKHGGDRQTPRGEGGRFLAKHGESRPQGDNVTLPRGNSRAYILARLDRDGHAELAAKIRSGALSANKAATEVGWRRKPTLTCPNCGHRFSK